MDRRDPVDGDGMKALRAEQGKMWPEVFDLEYKVLCRVVQATDCHALKVGDQMVFRGPNLVLEETTAVCAYALTSIIPFIWPMQKGVVTPKMLGLCRENEPEYCYVCCIDPGYPFTSGGHAVIRMERVLDEKRQESD